MARMRSRSLLDGPGELALTEPGSGSVIDGSKKLGLKLGNDGVDMVDVFGITVIVVGHLRRWWWKGWIVPRLLQRLE